METIGVAAQGHRFPEMANEYLKQNFGSLHSRDFRKLSQIKGNSVNVIFLIL